MSRNPPTDDSEIDVKKTSQPDPIIAALQSTRKSLEDVHDEASDVLKKKPKTPEEVDDLKKQTDAVEKKQQMTGKKFLESVGTCASMVLLVGATLAAGPIGAAIAYGVVKGVTKLWDRITKEKAPETPKPAADTGNQQSDTVAVSVKSTQTPTPTLSPTAQEKLKAVAEPKPAILKPVARGEVQQWRATGYLGQKTEATMNVVGIKEAKLTQLRDVSAFKAISESVRFKPAEPNAGKLPAMNIPITPSPKRSNDLTLQRENELKVALNLAIASGTPKIHIPKSSGFTKAEQACMKKHIQALNEAAQMAGTSAAAVAQSNPTDSNKMDFAIMQAPTLFAQANAGQDQAAVATQAQQQQQQQLEQQQQQQAAFQLQSQGSQLSESDKQLLVEFDTDDLGYNADDDLTSENDSTMSMGS